MSAHGHPVRMYFSTRCALHFEGVVERVVGIILRLEIGDPVNMLDKCMQ